MKNVITLFAAGALQASAKMSAGTCPEDLTYVSGLDQNKFMGTWYMQTRDMAHPYTMMADCITGEFVAEGDHMRFTYSGMYKMMLM